MNRDPHAGGRIFKEVSMRSTKLLRLVVLGLILCAALFAGPQVAAASWSCPFYTIICSTDSQCDAYCGGVGWGECISFGGARKCCACNT
jgi:hypothetical protein